MLFLLCTPFSDEPMMQYLYSLAFSREEEHNNDTVLSLLESQDLEYEKLLSLASTVEPPDILIQAINEAKSRNNTLERKNSSYPADSNKRITTTSSSNSSSNNNDSDRYKKSMEFVEQFKEARTQKGLKKMDWITCLDEGEKLGLLL